MLPDYSVGHYTATEHLKHFLQGIASVLLVLLTKWSQPFCNYFHFTRAKNYTMYMNTNMKLHETRPSTSFKLLLLEVLVVLVLNPASAL